MYDKAILESLQDLYVVLHQHSRANYNVSKDWMNDKDGDRFDEKGSINATQFERFMPKARKLLLKIEAQKAKEKKKNDK